jgi:hypothetical protein
LQLKFPTKDALNVFLEADCVHPKPVNYENKCEEDSGSGTGEEKEWGVEITESEDKGTKDEPSAASASGREKRISIEAKVTLTFGTGQAVTAKVEGVHVLSTKVEEPENAIHFDTEVIVRVSRPEGDRIDSGDASGVKTNLEVTAVYTERSRETQQMAAALEALKILNLGGFTDHPGTGSAYRSVSEVRLHPSEVYVTLTHALAVAVRSVSGPAMGQTFIALTMSHSNTHAEPVQITSIALHPGHTRYKDASSSSGVKDMSSMVKWGYAPNSDPQLPLTLHPNETFSTILTVQATEDTVCRQCSCPLSITACVGKSSGRRTYVVAGSDDASWTTCAAAVEPGDAFRVDLSLAEDDECIVGAPLTVNMNVYNLSTESRQLMLLVDSESKKASSNSVVVTEKDGYKFGVWGLSSDSGARDIPDQRERELLTMDTALLLGELKGQTSTKVTLRMIPCKSFVVSFREHACD